MTRVVRFKHETILDGRYHAITSPDVKGFCVSAPTLAEAEKKAIAVLAAMQALKGQSQPIRSIEFEAA